MGVTVLLQKFHRKGLLAVLIILLSGALHWHWEYQKIRLIDWWELYSYHKNIPQNVLIVYPGNLAYPAQMNNPAMGEDYANRLIAPEKLLMLIDAGGINGVSADGGERCIPARSGSETDLLSCRGYWYDLKEKSPSPGELVLLIDENRILAAIPEKSIGLNLHFRLPEEKRNTRCVVFRYEKNFNIPEGVRAFVIAE